MSDIQILVLMHVQLGLCYQDTTHRISKQRKLGVRVCLLFLIDSDKHEARCCLL